MKARLCTHVKITGHRCGSPALRGQPHCYFHHQILSSRQPQADDSQLHSIALIENEEAVQVALMQVIDALLKNTHGHASCRVGHQSSLYCLRQRPPRPF
jgi:hypothetical protein